MRNSIESINGASNIIDAGEDPWQKMANEVLEQSFTETLPTHNEKFETIRNNFQENYDAKIKQLVRLEGQIADVDKNDAVKISYFSKRLNSLARVIGNISANLKRMRPNNTEDLIKRREILANFSKAVDEVIPDDEPIVFHGVNNIEVVKTIIESGGLKTPEERGVEFTSFATQIDVTAKKNIQTTCNFADAGAHSFLPYGGIFVFYPKEYERENVLSTGTSTEVYNGVDGVDLGEKRFVGLITTDENIDEMKGLFQANGLEAGKVFTHEQFLEYCRKTFPDRTNH